MNAAALESLRSRAAGEPVRVALEKFLERDSYLLQMDVNERSITARIAMYLQEALPEWDVDCEFNRDGIDPKKLRHFHLDPDPEDTEAKTVYPDIVAHKRGTKENFLVIEFKKTSSTVDRDIDRIKLEGYSRQLGYANALYVELVVGDKPDVECAVWIPE